MKKSVGNMIADYCDRWIADCNEAIRLNPKDAEAFVSRGFNYAVKGGHDRAIADFSEAIRIDPKFAPAYRHRGDVYYSHKGDYGRAIADYNEVVRLDPKFALAYNNLAWMFATSPAAKFRDAKRAVKYAKKACKLNPQKDPEYLETLAAAYAAAGEFDKAIETVQQALAEIKGSDAVIFCKRLRLYKNHQPYRAKVK